MSKESNDKQNKKKKYKIKKSEKYGNPPKNNKNDEFPIGEAYIDSEEDKKEDNNNNKNGNNDHNINVGNNNPNTNNNYIDTDNNDDDIKSIDIKIQYKDYIESKAKNMPNDILEKKLKNLRKSL